ncbi:ras guanine nucleotide exchange factor R [Scaptodrosophila lebanonensis]|uniref:Ras guanine nucleotide exchange factor R n=1 Tax=Drosophila lebanonensis TaxID=7225 RepID=A0A6J2UA96_DROLE|nr:ras guanine nucleotide exchange factor R [Scaptodrosophila lebanonensis]
MSAAELEAENSAAEEHPQQQQQQQTQQQQQREQQQNEHTSNNSNTAIDAEATSATDAESDVHETIETTNSSNNNHNYDNNAMQQLQHNNMHQHAQFQQQQQQEQSNNGLAGLGLTLMQSSPPPHSYRHSRAYRHFKNPPQPHMCIRTTTETGEELFINVLSWTRIVIPQEPSDPIPLYGGMRVPPGSPRSPPIVFAVMANPEVLKDSGRHSKDPEERRAMVELMCDFVEAMNPGVKLVRNAVILKDRDISGELKDVWNAVQAQRDREREEQMLQQRQQQHYQNITTQQMFPKSPDAVRAASGMPAHAEATNSMGLQHTDSVPEHANGITLAVFAQQLDNKVASEQMEQMLANEAAPSDACVDQTDAGGVQHLTNASPPTLDIEQAIAVNTAESETKLSTPNTTTNGINTPTTPAMATSTPVVVSTSAPAPAPVSTPSVTATAQPASPASTPTPTPVATPTPAPTPPAPTKKEKLGGFLPNGCIFPRFKNNKHKDKDSNHKESKSKEKTLLNALKKSKEKKVAPAEQPAGDKASNVSVSDNTTTQYEKNCINNLECEVQKLDLNKLDGGGNSNNDNNMFIKLKVAPNAATVTATAAK